MKKQKLVKIKWVKVKKSKIIMSALLLAILLIVYQCVRLQISHVSDDFIESSVIVPHKVKKTTVAKISPNNKALESAYKILGKDWETAIKSASKEFNVPERLIIGIANAESGLGKHFYNSYDKNNCYNLWGLKGGNTYKRITSEGSWLRCFNDHLSGARTVAKTLRLYYLDEKRDTAEKISVKYVGANQSKYHKQWVANVNRYYK
jgi:hypothetical protein